MTIGIGDIFRIRNFETYGEIDSRNRFGFVACREKMRAAKRVFVMLLLGTEPLELYRREKNQFAKAQEPLEPEVMLNHLGWWSEEQIKTVWPKQGPRLIEKLHAADAKAGCSYRDEDLKARASAANKGDVAVNP
jgi:hypothetical protein